MNKDINDEVEQTDLSKVQYALKLSTHKKACGIEHLYTELFKYGPHCLIERFSCIIQTILKLQHSM
jgi:hypothetical protein